MKRFLILIFATGIFITINAQTKKTASPTDKKVNELLAKITLKQKVDRVGFDDYANFGRDCKYSLHSWGIQLKIVLDYACKANKPGAFT